MRAIRIRRSVALAAVLAAAVVGCENEDEAVGDEPPLEAELPATAPAEDDRGARPI